MRPQDEKQRLGERLRQQALADRPAFSPELHQRLWAAVWSRRAGAAATCQPFRPAHTAWWSPRWRFLLAAVGAAVVLGGVAIAGWLLTAGKDRPKPGPAPRAPSHDKTIAAVNHDPAATNAADVAAIDALLHEANAQFGNILKQTADWATRHRPENIASAAMQAITERVPLDALLALAANGSELFAPNNGAEPAGHP